MNREKAEWLIVMIVLLAVYGVSSLAQWLFEYSDNDIQTIMIYMIMGIIVYRGIQDDV